MTLHYCDKKFYNIGQRAIVMKLFTVVIYSQFMVWSSFWVIKQYNCAVELQCI